MKAHFTPILLIALSVAALGPGTSLNAEEIPLEASGLRVHVSLEKIPGGFHIINLIPDGESNLGDWHADVDLTRRANFITGTMEMFFNSGNSLTLDFEQRYYQQFGDFGGYVGEFVITGGTGRFRDAAGGGIITAEFLDRDAVDVLIELRGEIDLLD